MYPKEIIRQLCSVRLHLLQLQRDFNPRSIKHIERCDSFEFSLSQSLLEKFLNEKKLSGDFRRAGLRDKVHEVQSGRKVFEPKQPLKKDERLRTEKENRFHWADRKVKKAIRFKVPLDESSRQVLAVANLEINLECSESLPKLVEPVSELKNDQESSSSSSSSPSAPLAMDVDPETQEEAMDVDPETQEEAMEVDAELQEDVVDVDNEPQEDVVDVDAEPQEDGIQETKRAYNVNEGKKMIKEAAKMFQKCTRNFGKASKLMKPLMDSVDMDVKFSDFVSFWVKMSRVHARNIYNF